VAVPSALAAVGSPLFPSALTASLVLALPFLCSNSAVSTLDFRLNPTIPLSVVFALSRVLRAPLAALACAVAMALWSLTALVTCAPASFTRGEFCLVSVLSGLPVHALWLVQGVPRFSALYVLFGVICLTLSLVGRMPLCVLIAAVPVVLTLRDLRMVVGFVLSTGRVMLLLYCAVVCVAFVLASVFWSGLGRLPLIVQRKFFHLMALLVLVPPVVVDCELLRLCICGAVFAFLVVGSARVVRFPFVAGWIETYVAGFTDERDGGELILTHLFLLLGLGVPVLVCGAGVPGAASVRASGISVLAVGDACASVMGVRFGKHKWPGSKKSVEGTVGAFLGTWLCMIVVELCHRLELTLVSCLALALPAFVGAIDEAFTLQIDNLTLPFVMVPFVRWPSDWAHEFSGCVFSQRAQAWAAAGRCAARCRSGRCGPR